MLPLWIIDLGGSAASREKLQRLLNATGDSLKPYWHYFRPGAKAVTDPASCRGLMDEIVADGRECYNAFSRAGYKTGTFQIAVIGAAHEKVSQGIFAPLAGLIRDALPSIVADHANLGAEITGILYLPSTVNQADSAEDRTRTAMLLEEVNMLSERLGSKHYNRVVVYQDEQYKGARFYPRLDEEQRTELLFQILTHLFFVSAGSERFFDKIGRESGIFSLGVASVYYNSEQHHAYELKRLLDSLIAEFKKEGNTDADYAGKVVREILDDEALDTEATSQRLLEECGSLDIDLKKMDGEADPHPVWDLFRSDIFPRYYLKYLKYMPARLVAFMQSLTYVLLSKFGGVIRRNRENATEKFKAALWSIYRKVYLDNAAKYATIAQVESVFSSAKEYLLRKRSDVSLSLHEIVPVPKYLRNDYDKCLTDEEANKPAAILENLKKNLRKEPVVLSLVVRCFLLGILLVFTIIPLLRVLSPKVVNLGEIGTIEWLWIPVLFFLPLVIEFCIKLRRHFKRIKRLKYRLLAVTLLSVNRRLSQLLMDEQGQLYDALVRECDVQLGLLAEFREKLSVPDAESGSLPLPRTLFNQPLLGGAFCNEKLIEDESVSEAEIRVKDDTLRLSLLEHEDVLWLLKSAFRHPETLEAAHLSEGKDIAGNAMTFVEELDQCFGPELHINSADDAGLMLRLLGGHVNVAALERMAGVNGMLFSVQGGNAPVLRITNAPGLFGNAGLIEDPGTKDYALLTHWQKIAAIQSQLVCNCSLDPLPALSFADRLSLYYGFYRRKDLAYTIAGQPVRISKDEMDKLNKEIIGG